MTLLGKRSQVLVKLEATAGTDAILSLAQASMFMEAYEVTFDPEFEFAERAPMISTMGRLAGVPVGQKGKLTFNVPIKGSGTAGTAPALGKLLLACAMSETIVASTSVAYSPSTTAAQTITVVFDTGESAFTGTAGIRRKLVGGVGTVEFDFTRGAFAIAKFEFVGRFVTPVDVTYADIAQSDLENTSPVAVKGVTFTEGGTATTARAVRVSLANAMGLREDITETSSYTTGIIVDRAPEGTLEVEATTRADRDRWATTLDGTTQAISLTALGSVAGNIVAFSVPLAVFTALPEEDSDGKVYHSIPFEAAKSESGDDELTLTLT